MQLSQAQPAQPAYVFRGHTSQIHALHFYHQLITSSSSPVLTLASGDADGYITLWSLTTKRPLATWQAHAASILSIHSLPSARLATHGRDNKITIWRLTAPDLANLDTILPTDSTSPSPATPASKPFIERTINVGTVNFCGMHLLPAHDGAGYVMASTAAQDGFVSIITIQGSTEEETRELIPSPRDVKVGMVMAVRMFRVKREAGLGVLVGYESGHVAVWAGEGKGSVGRWRMVYMRKAHTQPVLSVDVAVTKEVGFSSAADGILAWHPLHGSGEMEARQTMHAGQQGLVVRRPDDSIFATAGWDGRVRVYTTDPGMKELAVLKWHKEGCYATAFANVRDEDRDPQALVKRELTLAHKRTEAANSTHWLAAGSKDGKVSLWDIY